MTATESDTRTVTVRSHSEPQAIQEANQSPVPRNLKSVTVIACFIEEYSDEESRSLEEFRKN